MCCPVPSSTIIFFKLCYVIGMQMKELQEVPDTD